MNNFQRLFGAGPRGLFLSVFLFFTAYFASPFLDLPQMHGNQTLGVSVFVVSILLTMVLIVWSAKSLNPNQRGRELVTAGAFRYFRHPLYASFLTFFNFGLSVFFDNYIYLVWAVIQHPVWHMNVAKEEKIMEEIFPNDYPEYCLKTGRFIPRLWKRNPDIA